jgi:hypothetical protein
MSLSVICLKRKWGCIMQPFKRVGDILGMSLERGEMESCSDYALRMRVIIINK